MSRQEIPEYAKQRIEKLQRENMELQAKADLTRPYDHLLLDIAESLRLADLASDPATSSPIEETKVSGSKSRPDPGASVRQARRARKILRSRLENAVKAFHVAAEHHWTPPRPIPEPMRRCRNRKCSAREKRIPKYVGPKESKIELTHCSVCGNKLGEA